MTIFDIINGIEQGYVNQMPNIREMRSNVAGYGWTVEYKLSFWARWLSWMCYHDCEYVLNRNNNDMRNYTA